MYSQPPQHAPPKRSTLIGDFKACSDHARALQVMTLFCMGLAIGTKVNLTLDLTTRGSASGSIEVSQQTIIFSILLVLLLILRSASVASWVYLEHSNLRELNAVGLKIAPHRAVIHHFIPVWNLYGSMVSLRELWWASKSPENWSPLPAPKLVLMWWLLYLVTNLCGLMLLVLVQLFGWSHASNQPVSLFLLLYLGFFTLESIPRAMVIGTITRFQSLAAASLELKKNSPYPRTS